MHCVYCDGLVKRDSMDEMAEAMLALGEGTRLQCAVSGGERERQRPEAAAKPARPRAAGEGRGEGASRWLSGGDSPHTETLKARLTELRAGGFNRLYQQGKIVEFSTPESLLDLDFTLPVFVLLDRIVVSAENRARIVDAAEIAYREAGEVIFEEVPRRRGLRSGKRHRFSGSVRVQELPPAGQGAGAAAVQLQQSVWGVPALPGIRQHGGLRSEPGDSGQGAEPGGWRHRSVEPAQVSAMVHATCASRRRSWAFRWTCPGGSCPRRRGRRCCAARAAFAGVYGFFAQMETKKYKLHVRVMLSKYRGYAECPDCRGQRLRAEARSVRINGKNICQATALTIAQAKEFFDALKLSPMQEEIAGPILDEVRQRLSFLDAVGLGVSDAGPAGFDAVRR